MDFIVSIFNTISGAGSTVVMPIIIALIGIIMGAGVGKSIRGGLMVGVGLMGLSLATGLMGTMANAVASMSARFGLSLSTIDIGWPAAAAIGNATTVGTLIIPVCLLVNIVLLVVGATQTADIDIWNYWHFAFTGSLITCVTGSLPLGLVGAICNEVIVLVLGDITAPALETTLHMPGVSMPHGFTAAFVPFALILNWVIEKIPGLRDIDFSLEGLQEKIGVFGEPIIVGFILGLIIGVLGGYNVSAALNCAVTMAATMVLIPRMASLLMEGLMPISDAAGAFIDKHFAGKGTIYIGMDSALGVGHPMTIALGLVCVPIVVLLAVVLPGNTVIPAVDLSVLPYIFVLVLPICKGNGFRSLLVGLICCILGLYIATDLAAPITSVAQSIGFDMGGATSISSICDGANPLTWALFKLSGFGTTVSMIVFIAIALACAAYNFVRIKKLGK